MKGLYEEHLPSQPRTIKRGGGRAWVHPTTTSGRYTRLRHLSSFLLLLALYATPWLKVGGQPFLKLSFLDTSFVLFGSHILIYEFYHFVVLALLLVFTLFFASSLYGRVWCGYACPQTVFVEQIFGRVETLFEGSAAKRLANESKPLTVGRCVRKLGKQIVFVAISASFAFTVVAIFAGTDVILVEHSRPANVAIALLTLLAWFDGAYWREQFCHIVCPYGRFQGLMQDAATRTIGYDPNRGEPRRRGKDRVNAGDCIDCGLCVRVCPSGIDIRQGAHQLECIGCAKCVDACNGIMRSIGKPEGLIRYDAVSMFAVPPPAQRPKFVRPRVLAYGAIWTALFTVGLYQYLTHAAFHAKILSARGAAPYFLDGDRVKNLFSVKLGNQWSGEETFELTVALEEDRPTAPSLQGAEVKIESPTRLGPIAPGKEAVFPVLVSAPRSLAGAEVKLTITALGSGEVRILERHVVGPNQ